MFSVHSKSVVASPPPIGHVYVAFPDVWVYPSLHATVHSLSVAAANVPLTSQGSDAPACTPVPKLGIVHVFSVHIKSVVGAPPLVGHVYVASPDVWVYPEAHATVHVLFVTVVRCIPFVQDTPTVLSGRSRASQFISLQLIMEETGLPPVMGHVIVP